MHILRTLGIVGTNQKITAEQMKAYDGVFAAPIPLSVIAAIAAMVDREVPPSLEVRLLAASLRSSHATTCPVDLV